MFTFKPEENSKHLRIIIKFLALSIVQEPRKITLSAYWRCDIVGPLFGSLMPRKIFLLKASSMAMFKPSTVMMNRNGERGSPCLTPFSMENSTVGEPLNNTDALASQRVNCG